MPVPANAVVEGTPARIVRFVETEAYTDIQGKDWQGNSSLRLNQAMSATLYKFPSFPDHRGILTVMDYEKSLPFTPKRMFMIQEVPKGSYRGNHAHRTCHQFLICLRGSCNVLLDDGKSRADVLLDSKEVGVHVPPMTWGIQYQFTEDAVLIVLASEAYDKNDYIEDYTEFVAATSRSQETSPQ